MEIEKRKSGLDKKIDLDAVYAHLREIEGNVVPFNTKRGYASDWRCFVRYCDNLGVDPLPPDEGLIMSFFGWMSSEGRPYSTLERKRAGLAHYFEQAGHPGVFYTPGMKKLFKGMRRIAKKRANALVLDDVIKIVGSIGTELPKDLRDRAMILVGFAGGFRTSELCSIKVESIEFDDHGMRIRLPRSRKDQDGRGLLKGIAHGQNPETCPVTSVKRWLKASGITEGPLWRGWRPQAMKTQDIAFLRDTPISGDAANKSFKHRLEAAGYDPTKYSFHSLRVGLVTEAVRQDKNNHDIRGTTGHTHDGMVNYYRNEADPYSRGVGNLGL